MRCFIQVPFGFVQKRQFHVCVRHQESVFFDLLLHGHHGLKTFFGVQRAVHDTQANAFEQTSERLVIVFVFAVVLSCSENTKREYTTRIALVRDFIATRQRPPNLLYVICNLIMIDRVDDKRAIKKRTSTFMQ